LDDEQKLRTEIVNVMVRLYQKNINTASGGGVAARIPNSEYFLVTPSSVVKPDLRIGDIVKCNMEGDVVKGELRPSGEKRTYLAIFKKLTNIAAIVHADSPVIMGLTEAGVRIKPMTVMHVNVGLCEVPLLPCTSEFYDTKGLHITETKKFDEVVIDKLKRSRVIILEKHGTYTIGESLREAFCRMELLEEAGVIMHIARIFRKEHPEGWTLA